MPMTVPMMQDPPSTPGDNSEEASNRRNAQNAADLAREQSRPGLNAIQRAGLTGVNPIEFGPGAGRGFDVSQVTGDLPLPTENGGIIASVTPRTYTTTVRTKTSGDPVAYQAHLDTYMSALKGLNAALNDTLGSQKSAVTDAELAAKASGNAEAAKLNAAGEVAISKTDAKNAAMTFFRSDPGNDEFIAAQRVRDRAHTTMDALRPRIDEEDAISIFDDPLRWAINQFTLPTLKNQYNLAARTDKSAVARMQTNFELTQAMNTVNPGVSAELIRTAVVAESLSAQAKAVEEAAKIRSTGAAHTASILMSQAALQQHEMTQWDRQAAAFAVTQSTRDAKTADVPQQKVVDRYNIVASTLGLPPKDIGDLKVMNAKQKAEMERVSSLPPGKYGANPGDAFSLLVDTGALSYIQENQPMLAKTLQAMVTSPSVTAALQVAKNNPKLAALSYNDQQAVVLEQVYGEEWAKLHKPKAPADKELQLTFDKLDPESPHKLKIASAVQYPALAKNMWTAEVRKVMETKKFSEDVTMKDMENVLLAKSLENPGSATEYAKAFTEYYRTAQLNQWVSSGADKLGVPRPDTITSRTMLINGKPVDQWNTVAVEHWLTVNMREQAHNDVIFKTLTGYGTNMAPMAPANNVRTPGVPN